MYSVAATDVIGESLLSRSGAQKLHPRHKYYSNSRIRRLRDGEEMDALALNGKHYRARYCAARDGEPPCLTFPGWSSEFDHRDDLTECCLAAFGTYSQADGLNLEANDFLAAKFNPVSRARGDIVLPNNKYYSRNKIASLPDRSKIDILVGDATSLLHYHGVFIAATNKSPARIHFPHWNDSYDTTTDVFDMCLSNRGEYSTGDGIIEATNNLPRSRSSPGMPSAPT